MNYQTAFKLLLGLTLLFGRNARAQDVHFSQFTETPLYRNPALAGIVTGDVRVQSLFRTQWNSVANAYKTGSLNAEYKMPVGTLDDYLTLGLQVVIDRAGTTGLTSTQVLPALNYHKSISSTRNLYLSAGFMGGVVQRRFDRSKMTTNNQYEDGWDGESLARTQFSYLDGSAGISLNANFGESADNNLVIGAAYHHFNRPKNSFLGNSNVQQTPKYVFSAGMKFGVAENAYLHLEADHVRQGNFTETIGGVLYGLKVGEDLERPDLTLQGGAFLRWDDSFIPAVKLDYQPYSFALSYDVNISRLKTSSYGRGGFELSLSYIGFLDRDNATLNALHCPRF